MTSGGRNTALNEMTLTNKKLMLYYHVMNSNMIKTYFDIETDTDTTYTNSLAKEFSKILIFEYFGYLKKGLDVFYLSLIHI